MNEQSVIKPTKREEEQTEVIDQLEMIRKEQIKYFWERDINNLKHLFGYYYKLVQKTSDPTFESKFSKFNFFYNNIALFLFKYKDTLILDARFPSIVFSELSTFKQQFSYYQNLFKAPQSNLGQFLIFIPAYIHLKGDKPIVDFVDAVYFYKSRQDTENKLEEQIDKICLILFDILQLGEIMQKAAESVLEEMFSSKKKTDFE